MYTTRTLAARIGVRYNVLYHLELTGRLPPKSIVIGRRKFWTEDEATEIQHWYERLLQEKARLVRLEGAYRRG